MTLEDFLLQTQADVKSLTLERLGATPFPHAESVFTELVMQHLAEIGMTSDPQVLFIHRKIGNATLRLSGYAVSDDGDQLDLFVSIYEGTEEIKAIPDSDVLKAADQCLRFLSNAVTGALANSIDQSDDAYGLILTVRECYNQLEDVRIFILTDLRSKSKSFKPREIAGKNITLEVMDIERLFRHTSEGKPRDELIVNFEEVAGTPLPCVYVPGSEEQYDYALTAIPGNILRLLYEKFGSQLLEANVRSFLSQTGKVNKGIRDTLRYSPEKFMAYNNGIVIVADEAHIGATDTGGTGIAWLKGMQIVNGGQTTASIYFTKRKFPETNLAQVRVPAKIIVLRSSDTAAEEALLSDISKYANSQNSVKVSDLSANKPFHVALEKLSTNTFCPDGQGRWFYERSAGSYNVLLAREGNTPAKLRDLKQNIPNSRKLTKTDIAKYIHGWNQRPEIVSLGAQKNFKIFSDEMPEDRLLPDVQEYKRLIALAILYRKSEKMIRAAYQQAQANITAYTIAIFSRAESNALDLDLIWQNQSLSIALERRIMHLSNEVNDRLKQTAGERMISEWAKKPECWELMIAHTFEKRSEQMPEIRG
ncbi:hypothetical protein FHS21_006220 [Phyllobacterium trifolii]|uniref:Abortive phage infection protein n=1 Tax=Phyllobacterium trifolii TaxID=300193 RepID=A0A839UFH5_9HYPH|nr:AIPR family protein [Phyllobacterium trifolii]MBB3149766.1 hypothetical protein [Phyllobacterium trifolii]